MATVRVNVARVGFEAFSPADNQDVDVAVGIMQSIWAAVGLQITVARFKIAARQVGRLIAPQGGAEAQELTERFAGPPDAVDMFVVIKLSPGFGVTKEVPGPCDKQRKGMTGVVVSLGGGNPVIGTTFAHELGHYLGLPHCRCADPACNTNLMRGGGCPAGSNRLITPTQAAQAKTHCFVTP